MDPRIDRYRFVFPEHGFFLFVVSMSFCRNKDLFRKIQDSLVRFLLAIFFTHFSYDIFSDANKISSKQC